MRPAAGSSPERWRTGSSSGCCRWRSWSSPALGFVADASSKTPEEAAATFGLAGLVSSSVAAAAEGNARWYALLVGFPILVYVTRGLLRALIGAHRLVWGEPRSATVKPTIRASLILLVYLCTFMFATAVMNWLRSTYGSLGVLGLTLAFLIYAVLWLFVTLDLPHKDAHRGRRSFRARSSSPSGSWCSRP